MQNGNLSDDEMLIWARASEIFQSIIARLNETDSETVHARAARYLHARMTGSMDSILFLCRFAQHDFTSDASALLRCMYDTLIQAIYMLHIPNKRDDRGQLYLDYYWVQKYRMISLVDKNQTGLAKHLRTSDKRTEGEKRIIDEFDKIKHKYATKGNQNRPRKNWYPGTLRELALEVGYEDEYEIVQLLFGGIVHSSPYATIHGSAFDGEHLHLLGMHLTMRYLAIVGRSQGISFTDEEEDFIEQAEKAWFDMIPGRKVK